MKHMDQLAIEEKYNPDNLFKKKTENVEKKENMQMIIKTEDAWYIKIIKAIADIFHKSKQNVKIKNRTLDISGVFFRVVQNKVCENCRNVKKV